MLTARLAPRTQLLEGGVFDSPWQRFRVPDFPEALQPLAGGDCPLHASPQIYRLVERGALTLHAGAQATLVAVPGTRLRMDPPGMQGLSPFAVMRRSGEDLLVESPHSSARVLVHDGTPVHRPEAWSPGLRHLLHLAGLTDTGEPIPATWEFHDLLFHARSRRGRTPEPLGATCRFATPAPPALKPARPGLPLEVPEPLQRPLGEVLETRRSLRQHGDPPLTVTQIGHLLHHAARTRAVKDTPLMQVQDRPYPGGGAVHELEVYLAAHRVQGLEAGLYRYDGVAHALVPVAPTTGPLLQHACEATGRQEPPQALLVLAARFERVAWKYQGMAYALILKDVGVLVQTLYLVATAMDLAVCAVGAGDSDAFARVAGTDPFVESSVGELILGSRPA